MKIFLILALSLALASCGQILSEIEASSKNEEGMQKLHEGDYEEAITAFKKAIENPKLSVDTRANIYRNIAQTFIELQVPDSAIHYSTLAANCYKKNSYEYLVNIADIEILTGKTYAALEKLKAAYAMKPTEIAVNNTLGLIYLGEYGLEYLDVDKALPYNQKAFEINKDRATEYVLAQNYYELGQFNMAEYHFNNLYNQYPDNVTHPLSLGVVKFRLGDHEAAEALFQKVLEVDPGFQDHIESFKYAYGEEFAEELPLGDDLME